MLPTDRAEFVRTLNGLASIKRATLTPESIEVWWNAMADWSLESFRMAASHLVKTCQFMPSPFDFHQLVKAAEPTTGEAWNAAIACAGSSAYRKGTTPGARIDRAVRALGGYEAIGMCDTEKLHFLERRFTEIYDAMSDADEVRGAVPALVNGALKRITDGR